MMTKLRLLVLAVAIGVQLRSTLCTVIEDSVSREHTAAIS